MGKRFLQESYFSSADTDDDVLAGVTDDVSAEQDAERQTIEDFRNYKYAARMFFNIDTHALTKNSGKAQAFVNAIEDYICPLVEQNREITKFGFFWTNTYQQKDYVSDFRNLYDYLKDFDEYFSERFGIYTINKHIFYIGYNVKGGELTQPEKILRNVSFIYQIMSTIANKIGISIFSTGACNPEVMFMRRIDDESWKQILITNEIYDVINKRQFTKERGQTSKIKSIIQNFTSKKGLWKQAIDLIEPFENFKASGLRLRILQNVFGKNDFEYMKMSKVQEPESGKFFLMLTVPVGKTVKYRCSYSDDLHNTKIRNDGTMYACLTIYPHNRHYGNDRWGIKYFVEDYEHNKLELYPDFVSYPGLDDNMKTRINFFGRKFKEVVIYGNDMVFDTVEDMMDYVITENAENVSSIKYKLTDFTEISQ